MTESYILAIYKGAATANQALEVLKTSGNRSAILFSFKSNSSRTLPSKPTLKKLTAYYQNWLLPDETALLIPISWSKMSSVQKVLREYSKSYALFAFPSATPTIKQSEPLPVIKVPKIRKNGPRLLAKSLLSPKTGRLKHSLGLLAKTLRQAEEVMYQTRNFLSAQSAKENEVGSVAEWGVAENIAENKTQAEWILDNWQTIKNGIAQIRQSLSSAKDHNLPLVSSGEYSGFPRIYAVALDMVRTNNGTISKETIFSYLESYQAVQTLTENELELLPVFLKLCLFEYVANLSLSVLSSESESGQASFWMTRLVSARAAHQSLFFQNYTQLITNSPNPPSITAVDTIMQRTGEEELDSEELRGWLEKHYGSGLFDRIKEWQGSQAHEQVVFRNVSFSLSYLSHVLWEEVHAEVSGLEKILLRDPAHIYERMDKTSRHYYREEIQQLASGSKKSELEVAHMLLDHALEQDNDLEKHVGYFLFDKGAAEFKRLIGYRPSFKQWLITGIKNHNALVFFGSLILLTGLGSALVLTLLNQLFPISWWAEGLITFLIVFISFDVAVQLVQYLLLLILPPTHLPKLDFQKSIPERFRTAVVIPTLLLTADSVRFECERLEIRYLANPDPCLSFGLLTDFADASSRVMIEDAELLEVAHQGIAALNQKYNVDSFFLFHRERSWSPTEKAWIGWERKRGKLEQFNTWLVGEQSENTLFVTGNEVVLKRSVFVITLDADNQLSLGSAHRLIGTLAHPLNRPVLDEKGRKLIRGYSIIMPQVSTSLPSATATFFSRIHSNGAGVDPYTPVSADFYQDLTGESNYQGKGIYDVAAFHSILKNRIPDSYVLSHDLLEGLFARVGLASDIELFDLFPSDYISYANREHRWVRGDWQIMGWLKQRVPSQSESVELNQFTLMNKWRIFDNLRRSIAPLISVAAVLVGWLYFHSPVLELLVIISYIIPVFLQALVSLFTVRFGMLRSQEFSHQLIRAGIKMALLPYSAYIAADAIIRVIYRKWISHRHLLEWQSSAEVQRKSKDRHRDFLISMAWIPVAFGFLIISSFSSGRPLYSLLFLEFIASPLLVVALHKTTSRKIRSLSKNITPTDRLNLRMLARKTWRYFDDFMSEENNFLPPDNYQVALKVELAQRTSPTNLGLGLLSLLSARDFGYQSTEQVIDRIAQSLKSIQSLERYRGHFFNWYSTETKEPIGTRYVSTVDSGNFAGALWTLYEGIKDLQSRPVLDIQVLEGLSDVFSLAFLESTKPHLLQPLKTYLTKEECLVESTYFVLDRVATSLKKVDRSEYWLEKTYEHACVWKNSFESLLGWRQLLQELPETGLMSINPHAHEWRKDALGTIPSLENIAKGAVSGMAGFLHAAQIIEGKAQSEAEQWLVTLSQAFLSSQQAAQELMEQSSALLEPIEQMVSEMEFAFLYDTDLRVFHIGYNCDSHALDASHYDLLASEARLGSLVAIANGQIPVEHWWALGRRTGEYKGVPVVLSWSGTMFEYLMPVLLTRVYENSFLEEACRNAVLAQKAYADSVGLPWGISESGFSAIDEYKNYQYFAFGSAGLGMRRGTGSEPVISPYSSVLGLMVNPQDSLANIERLKLEGMMGDYGLYEAIDYRREHEVTGEKGLIVYSYMAHHQGMSLLAIANTLYEGTMQRRFHNRTEIKAYESLLFEKPPVALPYSKANDEDGGTAGQSIQLHAEPVEPTKEILPIISPQVATMANSSYRLAISHRGGGYTFWKHFNLNRWRPDGSRDHSGQFFYIHDRISGETWSPTLDPVRTPGVERSQQFLPEKVVFKAAYDQIQTTTEVAISPEDPVEVRKITVVNLGKTIKTLEVSSFMELAMARSGAEKTHPVFNSMFIQTEWVAGLNSLLAWRRPRSSVDEPLYCGHALVSSSEVTRSYETDRKRFIGRGGSISEPKGILEPATNSTGFVLDPIFSIRTSLILKPGERHVISFVSTAAETRSEVVALLEKYGKNGAIEELFVAAWASAQLNMRLLKASTYSLQQAQKLSAALIYKYRELRTSIKLDHLVKPRINDLWSQEISGDFPLVLLEVSKESHLGLVRELLVCHAYLRMHGLNFDMVILTEKEHPVYVDKLHQLVSSFSYYSLQDRPGSVFLKAITTLSEPELTALHFFADVSIKAGRGSLSSYLTFSHRYPTEKPSLKKSSSSLEASKAKPLKKTVGEFSNGIGSFINGGKEYQMVISDTVNTPSPWINVVANQHFGFLASESGVGMTWHDNSQTNRITPWSNDPVSDTPSDATYLRDEETGEFWSLSPLPHGSGEYVVTHGQGYTSYEHARENIHHKVTLCVPIIDGESPPVRLKKISITNTGSNSRCLSLFNYLELVLGQDREEGLGSVITGWNNVQQLFTAINPRRGKHERSIMFMTSSEPVDSYSGNRTAFLGEGGNVEDPRALRRAHLGNETGSGYDPCAAFQHSIFLRPGEMIEICLSLGEVEHTENVERMADRFRSVHSFEESLGKTKVWWEEHLGVITVDIPDKAAQIMLNHWLLYQVVCCRIWARSAFFQSGGAFGFRDQLQDVMAIMGTLPEIARKQIITAAGRQFEEGDVQHWWHADTGGGIRTTMTDDLLWLPFVAHRYAELKGDWELFDEQIPFLRAPILNEGEEERFITPHERTEPASLYEHCRRAVALALSRVGIHELPLIGSGDWNDGLNRVGIKGKGESVWLAWFLVSVLDRMVEIAQKTGHEGEMKLYKERAEHLRVKIEGSAWDGNWYLRAFFDDGSPLGSRLSKENNIDSLSQSWSVIAKGNDKERQLQAMQSVYEKLVRPDIGAVLLFTPPYEKTAHDPGYIKGYPPGVRENGGQYTHGSLWAPQAFAKLKQGGRAVELLSIMNPILKSNTPEKVKTYAVEPYVMAADVYALPGKEGHGGWTWYTGSAGWMYNVWIEDVLGLKMTDNVMTIDPVIPAEWDGFTMTYKYKKAVYEIRVKNPHSVESGVTRCTCDGKNVSSILLEEEGSHSVEVLMGK